jgi:hypothetical protein
MAKVNVKEKAALDKTHEGATVRDLNAEQELKRSVMACMLWEDQFYECGQQIATRLKKLVAKVDDAKVAAMAIEARTRMKLRHAPLLLCRELARKRSTILAETLATVIDRADELAEFVAMYWDGKRQPLAAQVKKGLARAFPKFDAYQLAKYDRAGAVRLRDVLFLCHPKPRDAEQAEVWRKLAEGTLETPDTWEVSLSAGKDKRETWERLLRERKLGALALLRNLRNMERVKVDRGLIADGLAQVNAVVARELCEDATIYATAGDDYAQKHATMLLPARRGFALRDAVNKAPDKIGGGGIFLVQCMDYIAKQERDPQFDRVIVFTDEQDCDHKLKPDAARRLGKYNYMVNVASYRRGIGYGNWTRIDGWSEAVLDYINAAEAADQLQQ